MAHSTGALSWPLPVATAGTTLGDPALDYLASYCKAVLLYYCGTAWAARCPNEPVVRTAKAVRPGLYGLSPAELPALFVWREPDSMNRRDEFTDDLESATSALSILWIPHPSDAADETGRAPMWFAIGRALERGLKDGRLATWLVAGDTDPTAAARGSLLATWCGFARRRVIGAEPTEIQLLNATGETAARYPAVSTKLEVIEEGVRDPSVDGHPTLFGWVCFVQATAVGGSSSVGNIYDSGGD